MRVLLVAAVPSFFFPFTSACEGGCITGITAAFVGNYSVPLQNVFTRLVCSSAVRHLAHIWLTEFMQASVIAEQILPSRSRAVAVRLTEPLLNAFDTRASATMRDEIFPGYFHGSKCTIYSTYMFITTLSECQRDGSDPPGCPNPDCPVVCGTPGSLVHFYSTLERLAFNATIDTLAQTCSPGSSNSSYPAFEQHVLAQVHRDFDLQLASTSSASLALLSPFKLLGRRAFTGPQSDSSIKAKLQAAVGSMPAYLESLCGYNLTFCSWEIPMKVMHVFLYVVRVNLSKNHRSTYCRSLKMVPESHVLVMYCHWKHCICKCSFRH